MPYADIEAPSSFLWKGYIGIMKNVGFTVWALRYVGLGVGLGGSGLRAWGEDSQCLFGAYDARVGCFLKSRALVLVFVAGMPFTRVLLCCLWLIYDFDSHFVRFIRDTPTVSSPRVDPHRTMQCLKTPGP